MGTAIIFWIFLLASFLIIGVRGRAAERLFLLAMLAATVATWLIDAEVGINSAARWVVLVDVGLLLIALGYVVTLDRYWPIWFAAFQLISVTTEIAQLLFPNAVPGIYETAARFWSLPAIASIVVAVILDANARRRAQSIGA